MQLQFRDAIIPMSNPLWPHLSVTLDRLIANHPEGTGLTRTCQAVARLTSQIEQFEPGFAAALQHRLTRQLQSRRRERRRA